MFSRKTVRQNGGIMKKQKITMISFLSFLLLNGFIGCNSNKSENFLEKQNLIPPSLQQEKSRKQIVKLDDKQVTELNIQVQEVKQDNFTLLA